MELAQPNLFGFEEIDPSWKLEWQDMPEFVQEDLMPWKTLYVHFECEEDMNKFADLVKQRIYETTQYIWYPQADKMRVFDMRYVDEEI